MSRRVKNWARIRLQRLRALFGSKCAFCELEDDLEFDCIVPRGDRHHKLSTDGRATFYWQQLLEGNLQLLCARCHQNKTRTENLQLNGPCVSQRSASWNNEIKRRRRLVTDAGDRAKIDDTDLGKGKSAPS